MSDRVEIYDVQAIAKAAVNDERATRQRHIEDVARDLRAEFRREVMELREEVGELVADVVNRLTAEGAQRESEDRAIYRLLDARTEHVV